jgi:hypothetical protein
VVAIERLGAPSVLWPSVFGPEGGADPVTANGLATLDLTPNLAPLAEFSAQMERDLTGGSFSSIKLDLVDKDGTLADALGPSSATMAAPTRYFGPWVEVWEHWGISDKALRFRGYIDETSIQWTEAEHKTQLTALHASQLIRERLITDFPELLRPFPSVPTNALQEFAQSTADALLSAVETHYVERSAAAALESALWAQGQLSWLASLAEPRPGRLNPPPPPSAAAVVIGGTFYPVDHVAWDLSTSSTLTWVDEVTHQTVTESMPWRVARIYLTGAPNLTGILTLGAMVTWAVPESRRTHYLLDGSVIAAPAAGSDGAKSVDLNTVEQLAAGDVLTLTFVDSTSGAPRTVTADLPTIIDLDGEQGRAHLSSALAQGYDHISKVRRNSQDPVLFDGVAYARALVAPFTLDTSAFTPASTDTPVLVFRPHDVANPPFYGVHNLQTTSQAGTLRLAKRGADNGAGLFPSAGVWSGSWSGSWAWQGLPTADATHLIYGDVLQFPGGTNPYTAPVIYIEGDLSGGAATPPNGWRALWRTWQDLDHITQNPESNWNGTIVNWGVMTATGDIPAKVVAYAASTPSPGRYTRLAAGAWTFNAHTANATLGAAATPAITGTLPAGNWIALGMGIYASGDEQEALLGLVATGAAYPFTALHAVLLSQAAGGDLTLRQDAALWATGAIPAGPWALGGGLVVQTWKQTIDGLNYPHTVLHKLNGTTVLTVDLKTLEVIPQTICPLLRKGAAGNRVIGGWYALALETFADANYATSRRLRFLHLDETLKLINGVPEADPSSPTNPLVNFSRGEMVASIMPGGSLIARMVRTSNTNDEMAGLVGGRIFTVGNTLPATVERLKLGATVPQGAALTVAHSGDGMTAATYLEKFAAAQLASVVPGPDGNFALVSRAGGTLRLRLLPALGGGTQQVSVRPTERGKLAKTQAWQGYIRKVRVTYADLLTDGTASVEVIGTFDGGRILELDLSDLLASATMSVALGRAAVYWMGQPAPVITEQWVDRTGGVSGDLNPTWWADWRVGDRVVREPFTAPASVTAWKILKMSPAPEDRTVNVELRRQPYLVPVVTP